MKAAEDGRAFVSDRVVPQTNPGGRYEPASVAMNCHVVPSNVDPLAMRDANESAFVDGKNRSRSCVRTSQRCAILRREA
jgi:hypothetical protein